ncbi:MAG: pyridoxal-dependent decarboxylase [Alphaproteobacteria bacterium]|nr:pyridoxal-dependent decarboxylase [Alphaproteobacteria bacterium]
MADRSDPAFAFDEAALIRAIRLLTDPGDGRGNGTLNRLAGAGFPEVGLPEGGMGEMAALETLAPLVVGGARDLGTVHGFDHMDPPTPWVTWVTALWDAALNQNLLHPDVAPVARQIEARVVDWLTPFFGMGGGHMTPGSTIANLTALWAAREIAGVETVVHSKAAHLSVPKSAHLLGLRAVAAEILADGGIDPAALPGEMAKAALVLTAGTTNHGAIDALGLAGRAAWTHVDAAWAGPLRLSKRYGSLLDGIEWADSVAVSAHKWLYQPKESGLVLFRDNAAAERAVSFGGSYLALPNVGVLGSHGAVAVPLLATLMAWGREGVARRIDRGMADAAALHAWLSERSDVAVYGPPTTGVFLWRPHHRQPEAVRASLPVGTASLTRIDGRSWLRQVAANPMAEVAELKRAIDRALTA